MAITVMARLAVALPEALEAVTTYPAVAVTTAGVPLITPVVAFRLRPVGSAGLTA